MAKKEKLLCKWKEDDINKKISIEECVSERKSYGGTGIESVERQIKDAKEFLKK